MVEPGNGNCLNEGIRSGNRTNEEEPAARVANKPQNGNSNDNGGAGWGTPRGA